MEVHHGAAFVGKSGAARFVLFDDAEAVEPRDVVVDVGVGLGLPDEPVDGGAPQVRTHDGFEEATQVVGVGGDGVVTAEEGQARLGRGEDFVALL